MAETVTEGLRDLAAKIDEMTEALREARLEAQAAAVARNRANPRPTDVGFQAPWITGSIPFYLDFGRGA